MINIFNITQKTVKDLRIDAFKKINTLPLKYIDSNAHGDIISKIINDVDAVSNGLLQGLTQLFTVIVTILLTLTFMLSISPIITLVVIIVTPLSLFVASFIAKYSSKMFKEQSKVQGELSGFIEEMLSNQKIVNAFNYEQASINKFREINSKLYDCGSKAQFYASLSNPTTRFVNGLVYAAVGVIGTMYCIWGFISIGDISCFLTYANQYTKPFSEIKNVLSQLQVAFSSSKRLFDLLDEKSQTTKFKDSITKTNCKGNITFSKVCFSYKKSKKIIENFNLNIHFGQKVAIVGPTGGGKTTLVNLLMRFYDTLIFKGGSNLSAGQRQLICIARVILINPPMLILDEATSNIDTRTEVNIQETFN